MEAQSEISESMQVRIYNFVKTVESEEYREMSRKVALIHKEQEVLKDFLVKKNLINVDVEVEKGTTKAILSFERKLINRVDVANLPPEIREEYTKPTETYYKKTQMITSETHEKPKLILKLK